MVLVLFLHEVPRRTTPGRLIKDPTAAREDPWVARSPPAYGFVPLLGGPFKYRLFP